MYRLFYFLIIVFFSSCGTTYYVVRHAEKESTINMTTDVPLSAAGKERAIVLKNQLEHKHIKHIFSTKTIRAEATAQPLSEAIGVPIENYSQPDASFINQLKMFKGNTLIVGHSNTVDDIVNGLLGKTVLHDLPESKFDNLFIVVRKGKKTVYQIKHFGRLD